MNDLNILKSMLSGIKIERNMLIRRLNKTEEDKNDLIIDELQIKALETAISAISADDSHEWIPLAKRPMTEEEKERYSKWVNDFLEGPMILDCPLPDDGEEVLITVCGGLEIDTFYVDDGEGCYFENRDIDDVTAWRKKPEPYKANERSEMEISIDKQFIDDAVQEAIEEIKKQYVWIPKEGLTNGEAFQKIFPCDEVHINGLQEGEVHFSMKSDPESMDCFSTEWWNAPYKAESEE